MKKLIIHFILVLIPVLTVSAQGGTRAKDSYRESYDEFVLRAHKDYYEFRKKAIAEYTAFVRQAWTKMGVEVNEEIPKEEKVMPIVLPEAEEETDSWFSDLVSKVFKKRHYKKKEGKKSIQLPQNKVAELPPVVKQPEPDKDVKSIPLKAHTPKSFDIFGTKCSVRIGDHCIFKLPSTSEQDVADAIDKVFADPYFDNLLYDCLQERKKHNFSDWAYYQMLIKLTDTFYGPKSNEATLVLAFLYSQSGYLMRLARDENGHLYMMVGSAYYMYGKSLVSSDNMWFYLLDGRKCDTGLIVCKNAKFKNESPMTLQISMTQHFDKNPTVERTIVSPQNSDFSFTLRSNKNYIDFYNTVPPGYINDNYMTKFAMYANTPLEEGLVEQLYPQMKPKLDSLTTIDAVQQLLWWVQGRVDTEMKSPNRNCFQYAYDDDVWGYDRAFFGEESIFYPYNDCEDRAILMSHLVRELLGLDVVLVFYPGHLAMAVNFPMEVEGDYYEYEGKKYVVCDPTIVPGPVGETMKTMVGRPHTLIPLKRGPKWVQKIAPVEM